MAIYYNNQFKNYYFGSTGSLGKMYYGGVEVNPGTTQTAPPSVWTPEDLSNLYIWWRADTGITTSGTNVTSWASKAGVISRTLTQEVGTSNTVYNSSNSSFNNKATVLFPSDFNGGLGLTDSSSGLGANNSTIAICFIMSPQTSEASGYKLMGGLTSTGGTFAELVPGVSFPSAPNKYGAYVFTGGQFGTDTSVTNGGAQFLIADISNRDLVVYPNSTTPNGFGDVGVAAAGFSTCQWSLGGYTQGGSIFSGAGFYGEIMEMIVTSGSRWTAQDLSDLSNYVSTYY
jgi:hypothetical protein